MRRLFLCRKFGRRALCIYPKNGKAYLYLDIFDDICYTVVEDGTMLDDKQLILNFDVPSEREKLCALGRALSVPDRIRIVALLRDKSMNLNEISKALDIPVSSVSNHVNALAEAELLLISYQPGPKGHVKLCSEMVNCVKIVYSPLSGDALLNEYVYEMPVGMYSDCRINAPCGMASRERQIFAPDNPNYFYLADRKDAELIWFSYGYLSYNFPYSARDGVTPTQISFSMEICSEAVYYRNIWPSDITILINDIEIFTWTCPGDFGGRRGMYTPEHWQITSTQFGLLKRFTVTQDGVFVDDKLEHKSVVFDELGIVPDKPVKLTIMIKEDAKHRGGINIFGKHFGDYPQAIVMSIK